MDGLSSNQSAVSDREDELHDMAVWDKHEHQVRSHRGSSEVVVTHKSKVPGIGQLGSAVLRDASWRCR